MLKRRSEGEKEKVMLKLATLLATLLVAASLGLASWAAAADSMDMQSAAPGVQTRTASPEPAGPITSKLSRSFAQSALTADERKARASAATLSGDCKAKDDEGKNVAVREQYAQVFVRAARAIPIDEALPVTRDERVN
jgi:hypothetical protein